MAFKKITVTCNATLQTLYTTSNIIEGNLHSILVTNPTLGDGVLSIYYDGVEMFKMSVVANSFEAVPKPINVPAETTVAVNGTNGLLVLASAYEQAVDTVGATTVAQGYVTEANSAKVAAIQAKVDAQAIIDGAGGILPVGTITDLAVGTTTAWSSSKVKTELSAIELLIYAGV